MYASLAELELKAGHPDEAITWFQRGLDAVPNERDLLWNLSNLLIEENRIQDAQKNLEKLRIIGYPKPPLTFLEARLLIQKGNGSRPAGGWKRSAGPRRIPGDFQTGRLPTGPMLRAARPNRSATDGVPPGERRRFALGPGAAGAASALLATGRLDEALEEYRQVAALPAAPASVLVQLARLLVLVNLRRNPSEQDWHAPNQLLDKLEEIDSEAAAIPILRAEILVARGEDQKAEDLLLAARDKAPKRSSLAGPCGPGRAAR